jgi:hypothetical protein
MRFAAQRTALSTGEFRPNLAGVLFGTQQVSAGVLRRKLRVRSVTRVSMGKSLRLLFVVSIVALSAALIAPATTSAQGGGGIIIEGQAGTGLNTLHPFLQ